MINFLKHQSVIFIKILWVEKINKFVFKFNKHLCYSSFVHYDSSELIIMLIKFFLFILSFSLF